MARTSSRSTTGTLTLTIEEPSHSSVVPSSSQQSQPPETLVLRLKRPKKVSWKEGTVDNEFLNRKSSKKCCIFHKQKPFDEDDSDEEDCGDKPVGGDSAGPSRCCSHGHDH
ncbi:unnamed protein product [Musa hybrid cultivar]